MQQDLAGAHIGIWWFDMFSENDCHHSAHQANSLQPTFLPVVMTLVVLCVVPGICTPHPPYSTPSLALLITPLEFLSSAAVAPCSLATQQVL